MNYGKIWKIFIMNLSTNGVNNFNYEKFYHIIEKYNNFIITTHVNPDGDAIGSALALYYFVKGFGKSVRVINYNSTPKYYSFMDPDRVIEPFTSDKNESIENAEVIFIVDLNDLSRIKTIEPAARKSKALKVIIDHHQPNSKFADAEFTDTDSSSTGEILYKLISNKYNSKITKEIAVCLYAAILTDTQSFHLPRSTAEVYRIAADLIDKGANPSEIYRNIYEINQPGRFYLLSETLSNMQIIEDGKIVYFVVKQEMFDKTNTMEPDVENFINYGMQIETAEIVIFFVELKDGLKMSFRSRNHIAVNELAKEFGGNGHKNAAGARLFNVTLADILPKAIEKAKTFLN
jgi:bifunctional oligoribonuclease and PAP phosphatase NrnA